MASLRERRQELQMGTLALAPPRLIGFSHLEQVRVLACLRAAARKGSQAFSPRLRCLRYAAIVPQGCNAMSGVWRLSMTLHRVVETVLTVAVRSNQHQARLRNVRAASRSLWTNIASPSSIAAASREEGLVSGPCAVRDPSAGNRLGASMPQVGTPPNLLRAVQGSSARGRVRCRPTPQSARVIPNSQIHDTRMTGGRTNGIL